MRTTDGHLEFGRLRKEKHKTHPPVFISRFQRHLYMLGSGPSHVWDKGELCGLWLSGAHAVCPGEVSLGARLLALNTSPLQEAAWLSPQENILGRVHL